jgi:hypothetical protein
MPKVFVLLDGVVLKEVELTQARFEALFYKQLHNVTARIHDTENLDQIMLEASQDICKLLNADRLTLYAVNEDRTAIVSKVKTGLNSSRDLKLPITPQSMAGYAAFSKQQLNLADVYDDEALKQIHPVADLPQGSRQALRVPHPPDAGGAHPGWRRVAWRAAGHQQQERPAFGELEVEGRRAAVQDAGHRHSPAHAAADEAPRKATKYDGLVADGVMTASRAGAMPVTDARDRGQAGRTHADGATSRSAGADRPVAGQVLWRALRAVQRRAHPLGSLHGPLKREFIEEQGWIPLEECRRRQRTGQVGQQDHHRRLQPGAPPTSTSSRAGQGKDRHPLPHRRHAAALHRGAGAFPQAMVTRLKIMCDLDISERRKPQDGKIKFKKYGPLDIELRVATIPTAGGVEDVVMRILAAGEPIPLDKLG